jgi:peptide/nickel transport system ATP-binding protein
VPGEPAPACRFHTRCPYVQETRCRDEEPLLRKLESGHWVGRHWAEDIKAGMIEPHEVEAVFETQAAPAGCEPPPL